MSRSTAIAELKQQRTEIMLDVEAISAAIAVLEKGIQHRTRAPKPNGDATTATPKPRRRRRAPQPASLAEAAS